MRGFDGLVTVDHRVNEAPRRWGYHLLGPPYDPAFRRPRRYFEALEEYLERRERPRLRSVGIGEDAELSGLEQTLITPDISGLLALP